MTSNATPVAAVGCTLHRVHTPANLTVELHHLVPVAWQLHTQVAAPPFPGQDTDGRGLLWDSRGALICPTGHRNTHAWIVAMMRAIAETSSEDVQAAYQAVRPRRRTPPVELQTAVLALTRYQPYGSLLALTRAGEWGQI